MPPVDANIPTGQNLTVAFLARLAEKAPGAATDEEKLAFEKLCRKVDVAKKVWMAYDRGWAKPTDKTPLPASTWPLLATAFLYHATQLPSPDDNIRGRILKLINSAFNTVELGRKAGAGNMKTVAHQHLRIQSPRVPRCEENCCFLPQNLIVSRTEDFNLA